MGRIEKLKRQAINEANIRLMGEAKKSKKSKDSEYDTWCKEHGWENGVSKECANDALDSNNNFIRAWALGFIMGNTEEEDERRYDDRQVRPLDDESRYDDRNYQYGNNPDDDLNEDEELPTVRRSDRDMLRRRPYSPKARFKAGL